MMLAGGTRISQHLREFNHHHYSHRNKYKYHQAQGFGLGFCCSTRILELSCFILKPPTNKHDLRPLLHQRVVSTSSLQSKPPGESSILSDCLSPSKDECEVPPERLSSVAGRIVALGKFDALHVGHRELAIQASKVGVPCLLSFVGMAEVLGWEPRAPVVAKCDRSRVLSSWTPYCGNIAPAEFQIEFSCVRHLTPRQFVEKLSKELEVCGVVAGENYRFGYKAAGDAKELVKLCEEYSIRAHIIDSVMDRKQNPGNVDSMDSKERGQVSSTRVRHALAAGDMKYVSELLGRPHRLMMMLKHLKGSTISGNRWKVSAPKSCLLNLPPKDGLYENCSLFVAYENAMTCSVFIDASQIHLEMEEFSLCNCNRSQDFQLLGIEFGG